MPKSNKTTPKIVITGKPMHKITKRSLKALVASNRARTRAGKDPQVYVHGGHLAQIRTESHARLEPLTFTKLKGLLDRAARFKKVDSDDKKKPARPPDDVVKDLLELQHWPRLPSIESVVAAPTYTHDGVLHVASGYNKKARTFLAYSGPGIPDVPDSPTAAELESARGLLLDDLLVDFPFKTDSDSANAVAMLLLPFVRQMIKGTTPLHVVEASTPGTGKTLLVRTAMSISQGGGIAAQAETRSDEEFRKRLTAVFAAGESVVFIDNIAGGIASGVLANAVTSKVWTDRLLGSSTTATFRNRLIWIVTGNNLTLSTEIARRSLRIRLMSTEERPWEGRTFQHTRLDQWARDHRGELIAACLTLVNGWIAGGRPRFAGEPLGSFEEWSDVLGGILSTANISGFLDNRADFYEEADAEADALGAFVEVWHAKFGTKRVGAKDLLELALQYDGSVFDFRDGTEASQSTQLGKQLSTLRDKRVGSYQITRPKKKSHGAVQYFLKDLSGEGGEGGEVVGTSSEGESSSGSGADP